MRVLRFLNGLVEIIIVRIAVEQQPALSQRVFWVFLIADSVYIHDLIHELPRIFFRAHFLLAVLALLVKVLPIDAYPADAFEDEPHLKVF